MAIELVAVSQDAGTMQKMTSSSTSEATHEHDVNFGVWEKDGVHVVSPNHRGGKRAL